MRNLALGCVQYQTIYGAYPPSVVFLEPGDRSGPSWVTKTLPYLDNQELFNAYNKELPAWHEANAPVVGEPIAILRCPQNPNDTPLAASLVWGQDGTHFPGNSTFAPSHYAANWGGSRSVAGTEFRARYGSDRGLMLENRGVRAAEVTDGQAFTIMLAEKRRSFGWAVGGWGGSEFDVTARAANVNPDPTAELLTTGSHHEKDAVNVAFGDGSVRCVTAQPARAVWYGLMTRDGREPVYTNPLD